MALRLVPTLHARKTVSNTQSVISSWLKADFILGPQRTAMANPLPRKPKPPITELTTPVSHHFQDVRI